MGYRNPYSLPGTKTWVDEDNTKNIPPDAHKTKNPANSGGGQSSPASKPDQRTQALPRTRNTDREIRRPAQPVYNAPGESGSHPDGNLHEDRVRTKGKPGDQYKPQPIDHPRGQFRRRTLTSDEREADSNMGRKPSGQARQRSQKGMAKKKSHLWYLKNRKNVIRKQMLRYRKIRKKGLFKRDKRLRRQHPNWFARKPGGGYNSAKQRATDYRKGKTRTKTQHNTKGKKATLIDTPSFVIFYDMPVYMQGEGVCELRGINGSGIVVYRYKDAFRKISLQDFFLRGTFAFSEDLLEFVETLDCLYLDDDEVEAMDKTAYSAQKKNWGRRKRKRGIARVKSRKYRMANRGRIKAKQRLYRTKLKRNPKFKRIQKLRRKMQKANPRRFRVRTAEVLTSNEIAFVTGANLTLGFVRNLSTMTGWVTYRLESGRVASMPLPAFWNSVVLLSEGDVNAMFDLIDVEIGHEAFGLEMDYDQMRMCIELLEYDGNSEEFREMCMTETGVASISAMSADQLGSVASALMHKVLVGGGRQITEQPANDVFPRDADDRDEQDHGKTPMYFGQVKFPEEGSDPMPNSMPARVASRCADIGVYDKADLVRRETKPKEKSPTSLPDGSDEDAAFEGLPTWVGPNKLKEERENQKPAQGIHVDRDRPGAPGSARVIPRGTGFVGRTAAGELKVRVKGRVWKVKIQALHDVNIEGPGVDEYGSLSRDLELQDFQDVPDDVLDVLDDHIKQNARKIRLGGASRNRILVSVREVMDFLKGLTYGNAGGALSVDFYESRWGKHFSVEPEWRQRLDHYGNGGDGWDSEGWEEKYEGPIIEAVQPKLDRKFGRDALRVNVNEKGHVSVHVKNVTIRKESTNRMIVAAKMAEIMGGCSDNLHERSIGLTPKLRRVDQRNAVWLFDVSGGADTHRVRLKAIRNKNLRTLKKADILVSCDCNFWQWQGPEHWAKVGGYLYGKPMGTATKPVVKDPEGQHRACKHVLSVLTRMEKQNVSFRAKSPNKPKRRKQGESSGTGRVPRRDMEGV